jgi:hypothetical protein
LVTWLNGRLFVELLLLSKYFVTRRRRDRDSFFFTLDLQMSTMTMCGCSSEATLISCVVRLRPIYAWEFRPLKPTLLAWL